MSHESHSENEMTDEIEQGEAVHVHGMDCWDVAEPTLQAIHEMGQAIGAVLAAIDQAGYTPVAVDSAEFSHGVQLGHALFDGLMLGFHRVLGDRQGTDWDVSGQFMGSTNGAHMIFSASEMMLAQVSAQHALRTVFGHLFRVEGQEDALTEDIDAMVRRLVLNRNSEGLSLVVISEATLDHTMLHMASEHHDDGTPGIRFVDITTRLPMGEHACLDDLDEEGAPEDGE